MRDGSSLPLKAHGNLQIEGKTTNLVFSMVLVSETVIKFKDARCHGLCSAGDFQIK